MTEPDGEILLVLFDGVCGFCNRSVQFLLARDRIGRFRFAPLQGELAERLGRQYGFDVADLDTMYLVADYGGPNERVLARSAAVFTALGALPVPWSWLRWLAWIPRSLTDAGYRFVARHRYRLFGRRESCPLPPAEWRSRFL